MHHTLRLLLATGLGLTTACTASAPADDVAHPLAPTLKRAGVPVTQTTVWRGNGARFDDGVFTIETVRCDENEGAPYLLWVLTAQGADGTPVITIDGASAPMSRVGNGSFRYAQTFQGGFAAPVQVSATYESAKVANLVLGHGCPGEPAPDGFSVAVTDASANVRISWAGEQAQICEIQSGPLTVAEFMAGANDDGFVPLCDTQGARNVALDFRGPQPGDPSLPPTDTGRRYRITTSPFVSCTLAGDERSAECIVQRSAQTITLTEGG